MTKLKCRTRHKLKEQTRYHLSLPKVGRLWWRQWNLVGSRRIVSIIWKMFWPPALTSGLCIFSISSLPICYTISLCVCLSISVCVCVSVSLCFSLFFMLIWWSMRFIFLWNWKIHKIWFIRFKIRTQDFEYSLTVLT